MNRVLLQIGLILFIYTGFLQPAWSQLQQVPDVEIISSENGLSQVSISCMLQDSKGFLWIGTQDGLNLYDGISFKVFQQNPNDTNSLTNNFVKALAEDSQGNIWVGTLNGISMYDRRREVFVNYFSHVQPDPFDGNQNIFSLYVDRENMVWINNTQYLLRFDPATKKTTRFRFYRNLLTSNSDLLTLPLLEDRKGRFWMGTEDGLNLFDRSKGTFKRYANEPGNIKSLSNDLVHALYEDPEGILWVGTADGLDIFDSNTETFQRVYLSANSQSLSNNITCITGGKSNTIWVGTGDALYRIQKGSLQLERIAEVSDRTGIRSVESVSSMLMDKSDILWLGFQQGLIKFDTKPKKFQLIRKDSRGFPALADNDIGAIFEDDDRQLWIGHWEKGLDIYNRATHGVIHYDARSKDPRFRISDNSIHVIFKSREGNIFVGTDDGLDIFDRRTRTFSPFCKATNAASCSFTRNNRKYSIIQDRNGNLWIGTAYGLHEYEQKYGIFKSIYSLVKDSLRHDLSTVNALLEDRSGLIWMGTNNGLIRLNSASGEFLLYSRQESDTSSLSSNSVYCLFEDSRAILWIGTGAGLDKYDPKTNSFKIFTTRNGLPNNVIYGIVEDRHGKLWISTNRGIAKFDPASEECTTFDLSDGLQNYEFNLAAVYKSQSGEIFFGGIDGINYFFPDSMKLNSHIPPVQITSFGLLTARGVKNIPLFGKEFVTVPANSRSFSIEFAALDYTNPLRNKYLYKLQKPGEDLDWTEAGNHNFAPYNNVPPGNYEFRVRGSNSDHVWNEEETILYITVKSPFYLTHVAYAVYALFIILLVLSIIRWRTSKLRFDNKILREKQLAAIKIAKQKEELTIKNKNITDSLNYAKRIQQALMPSERTFRKILPVSFVLHKPKDIVSGDFYWINESSNRIYVAAIDCTGHGVPGAFMSIIGFELFRNITYSPEKNHPDQILNILNNEFASLFKDVESISLKDGMDIALCVIDKDSGELTFSGAFNPLYIIRDNKIIELKGDRFSVGLDEEDHQQEFTSKSFILQKDDVVYMFSDGYADQFGGPDGKKFKYRRFRHILLNIHHFSLDEQKQLLEQTFENWRGSMEQVDDILVMGFRPEFTV